MRIVHVCLAASYNDGWGYQENILAQIHSQMGLEVFVLTSDYVIDKQCNRVPVKNKDYVNDYGIHIISLTRSNGCFSRFNKFNGVLDKLNVIKPDIIFVHGGQFVSLKDIVRYCSRNKNVRLYIDQHGDYYNMSIISFKSKILQKFVYGHWMRRAIKYCNKFWGVTPWRCQYLNEVYGIPKEKVGLLVMGGDDSNIHFDQKQEIRNEIRNKLGLKESDFVVITGGKIDRTKNIHLLMEAISELNLSNLKLVCFGQPTDDMVEIFNSIKTNIIKIGWLESSKVYDYFLASDLVVFPGTHSVLWEQACACGIPMVCKHWEGMHHVDVGGNCKFLYKDSVDEIKSIINSIYSNPELYKSMKKVSIEKGIPEFSYDSIAKRSIEI